MSQPCDRPALRREASPRRLVQFRATARNASAR